MLHVYCVLLVFGVNSVAACNGGIKWHPQSGSEIFAEEEAIREKIKNQLEEEDHTGDVSEDAEEGEEVEEDGDDQTRLPSCKQCTEETEENEEAEVALKKNKRQRKKSRKNRKNNPRFFTSFFGTTEEEDLDMELEGYKDLPCCPPPKRLANATSCGTKPYNNRILGGVISKEHEFPWHCALLKKDGSYFGCGAVLLSCDPVIIVTAAHCFVREANPENIRVSCGAHRIDRPTPSPLDEGEIRMQVTEVLRHEDFRWLSVHSPILGANTGHPSGLGLFENDITVLKVDAEAAGFQCKKKEIWPACLPTPGLDYAGWAKTGLAGWGFTEHNGNVSKTLMKVNAPIVTDDYCQRKVCQIFLGPIGVQNCVITPSKICAGGVPDQGPCQGDSGGALLAQDQSNQGWAAVGLVSYQPGHVLELPRCGSDKFTVFTEVSKYLPWIAAQFGMLPPL